MSRDLVLLRHATAEERAATDFDRPLTARGRDEAAEVGSELARRSLVPGLVVASPAPRAWSTAELVCAQLRVPPERLRREPGLYDATPRGLLRLLGALPPVARVLVVGHNPTLEEVAVHLTGDEDLQEVGLPKAGVVAMALPDDWADLGARTATAWQRFGPLHR